MTGADAVGRADVVDWGVFAQWHELMRRGDPRFVRLSTLQEAPAALDRIETTIRTSMWNVQRHFTIHSLHDAQPADARLTARRVEMRLVLPPRVVERRCPLVGSRYPYLRTASVADPMMVCDRRLVLLGDATADTLWMSTDPSVVAPAVEFYEVLWASAVPAVPPGQDPPFTPRMVEIGFLLVDGATDREIARALDVSERTVSADVHEMSRRLGARSRSHAIALISGVDG